MQLYLSENWHKDRFNAEILDACQESVALTRLFGTQSNIYDRTNC